MGHKMTPHQRKWQLDRLRRWMNTDEAALRMIDVDTEAGPPGAGDPGEAGVDDENPETGKIEMVCWSTWGGHELVFRIQPDGTIKGMMGEDPLERWLERKRLSQRQVDWLYETARNTFVAISSTLTFGPDGQLTLDGKPVDPGQATLMRIN